MREAKLRDTDPNITPGLGRKIEQQKPEPPKPKRPDGPIIKGPDGKLRTNIPQNDAAKIDWSWQQMIKFYKHR